MHESVKFYPYFRFLLLFWIYLAGVSRYHSYLNSATQLLAKYNGEEPFASFLKKYFSANKRFGSTDRRQVSHLCYCYFRLGKALLSAPVEERILTALFLCSQQPNAILESLRPEWNQKVALGIEEKCSTLNVQCSTLNGFPWKDQLSAGIDHEKLCESFFVQPDLFLRLRPGKEKLVQQKLQQAGIEFNIIDPNCLALPNASKIDTVIELNKEAVVQDYNSQRVGEFMVTGQTGTVRPAGAVRRVWDCCAASGGKSIMAYDLMPGIELTVSDIRESILVNLKKRFSEAGIKKYHSLLLDGSKNNTQYSALNDPFSMIIADVPCTGSGTWSRTPEQLFYFKEKTIEEYAVLQRKILRGVIPHLEKGGYLLYITCSVFKEENEEAVAFIQENFGLEVMRMEVLKGYDRKADTLFAALLRKPL